MSDSQIFFGDQLKALDDNGKVGGYAVRFSDGKRRDLSGEYFTAETYLGAHQGDGVDVLFHHGQPLQFKAKLTPAQAETMQGFTDHLFSPVKTRRDDVGLWAETVLALSDEYEKAVFGLVKAGKLGWSSGTAGHAAKKSKDGEITRWPIVEISLTPTPCEPLNRAIPIKSLDGVKFVSLSDDEDEAPAPTFEPGALAAKLSRHIADIVDSGHSRAVIVQSMATEAGMQTKAVEAILAGKDTRPADAKLRAFSRVLDVDFGSLKAKVRHDQLQTTKGMFEEALSDIIPSRWELESVYCRVVKDMAGAAKGNRTAGVEFDLEGKLREATGEYTTRLLAHAIKQIAEWLDGNEGEDFYLKAIVDPKKDALADIQIDLTDHSDLLVSGLKSVLARFRGNHAQRVKAGRVLSEKNRARLISLAEQLSAVGADIKALLDESQPMASDSEKRAAFTQHLRLRVKQRELGV